MSATKNPFEHFPTVVASHLVDEKAYLVPQGVAQRLANGFEELLVSYPAIDQLFPEAFALYTEEARKAPEVAVAEPEKEAAPAPVAPKKPGPKPGPKPKPVEEVKTESAE
jgi:hypothetical protein